MASLPVDRNYYSFPSYDSEELPGGSPPTNPPSEDLAPNYQAHPFQGYETQPLLPQDEPFPSYYGTVPEDNVAHVSAAPLPREVFDPHWDDMVNLRQANVTLRFSRAWSEAESVLTEASRLAGDTLETGRRWSWWSWRIVDWTDTSFRRFFALQLLPVVVVLAWCAVPIPVDWLWPVLTHPNTPNEPRPAKMNFWFFLFFYYGGYNAIALWLVNQIFRTYALNWWPESMNALSANVMTWLSTLVMGAVIYHSTLGLETYTLTWVLLTLTTLLLPVLVSLGVLRSQNRNRHRHSLTEFQKIFLAETEWRIPSSYRRFLWFCLTLSITYIALLAGEYLANEFISTPRHSSLDGLLYVYTWVVTVFVLGWVAEWIIEVKIRSWPLIMIYRHYFTMIYFIFYRNLFVRLRSLDQFILVQLGSSLWVVFIYPIRMSTWVHNLLVRYFGMQRTYEDYTKQISRTFFLRNYAENTTMMAFLASVLILHYGPNAPFYPYFSFQPIPDDRPQNPYTLTLTLWASAAVWVSELVVSLVTRWIVWWLYGHSIGQEAAKDFQRYPEIALGTVLVIIHVLQDMLLALIRLDFS
ncbi:hypothetical protein IWQ61_006000 [Dispira simplex]|nr:hypothetical protein IWQ61_006000 [Dispira simplex]